MFIASLFCSKLSGTMGLRLMSRRSQKVFILACDVIVGLWGFTAFVVNFFQCQMPTPWDYSDADRCIDRKAFWTYYSIANIVTDLAIIGIMVENVRRIQTSWAKKILVTGVFGSRILYVMASRLCSPLQLEPQVVIRDANHGEQRHTCGGCSDLLL